MSTVGECADCHTERSMVDGSFTGPRLAGGGVMGTTKGGLVRVPPNVTPDSKTGRLASWGEDQYRYLRSVPPVERDPSLR